MNFWGMGRGLGIQKVPTCKNNENLKLKKKIDD